MSAAVLLVLLASSILTATWASPDAALCDRTPLPPREPWAMDRPQDGGGSVELGWKDSPSQAIKAYRVYRSRNSGGPYELVSERPTDAFLDYLGYVDTGLKDGATYFYVITAVDGEGRESGFSEEVWAVPMPQKVRAAVAVRKSMVISLAEQRLYCLENERVVHVFLVSTGTAANPTPTGNFRILYHDLVHPVPKYSGTVCYYWMGFYQDYAIHAWPVYNGVQGDYSGLGRPASHGCVRLDPTLAHIPYYWAPDGTPLTIIPGPFQPPKAPISGGHVAASVSEPSREWYFAEGYTGGGFDEYILVLNPEPEPANTAFEFMLPDGSVRRERFTAGPHSRMTVPVDALPGLEDTDVSVRITSDRPVVAERAMYFDYRGKTGGHVTAGATSPSREWYFAEGYTGGGFDEYILVLNPEPEPANTAFEFMLPDGSVRRERFTAGPHSRMTVPVDALPGLEDTDLSVRITSDRPVVAERAMYFGYRECPGGHAELGRTEPVLRHYLAEGYTSPYYDAFLLLMNPGGLPTPVRINYMKPDGDRVVQDIEVPAHARTTILVNRVPGMESTEFSVLLESRRPVFVERAMYFNFPR